MQPVYILVARDEADGIGRGGTLPWSCPADMTHFRRVTKATTDPTQVNALVVGWKTRQSLPPSMPGRLVCVMERDGTFSVPEEAEAITESVFLGGGSGSLQVYMTRCRKGQAPWPRSLLLTRIHGVYGCDVSLPDSVLGVGTEYLPYKTVPLAGCDLTLYIRKGLPPLFPPGVRHML
jgi:dihydrofolate reductase